MTRDEEREEGTHGQRTDEQRKEVIAHPQKTAGEGVC
jgi:hypothetical protein